VRRFCELIEDAFPPVLPTAVFRERLGELFDVFAEPTNGILRPAGIAERYRCPTPGGDGCPRRVVDNDDGTYDAVCGMDAPECDDVRGLTRADLDLQRFDCDAFLDALCRAGSLDPRHDGVMIPPYTFRVGDLVDGHRPTTNVFFAARPAHPGFVSALGWIRSAASNALVLLPTLRMLGTGMENRLNGSLRFAALDRVLGVEEDQLVLRIPAAPWPAGVREASPDAYAAACGMVYSDSDAEGRLLTREERERLLAKPDAFDVLVDGVDSERPVWRQGASKPGQLSASELEILIRYVQRRALGQEPCTPVKLGITEHSAGGARKTFIRMRGKVDTRIGGQKYKLFKQHRRFHGGESEYAFEPDAGFRYCIVAPNR